MSLSSALSSLSHVHLPSLALHVAASGTCYYAMSTLPYMHILTGHDIESEYGGHYQFLTILSLKATQICMALAVAADLMPSVQMLRTAKTLVHIGALPVETLVTILYWTLVTISPDFLIKPKIYENAAGEIITESMRLPLIIDLAMHLAPAVWLLIDYLAFAPPFPKHVKPSLIAFMVTMSYCAWCEWCSFQNGFYPYPLLGILGTPRRMTLYVGCCATMTAVLSAASKVHDILDRKLNRSWVLQKKID